jgi:hypothetical protein
LPWIDLLVRKLPDLKHTSRRLDEQDQFSRRRIKKTGKDTDLGESMARKGMDTRRLEQTLTQERQIYDVSLRDNMTTMPLRRGGECGRIATSGGKNNDSAVLWKTIRIEMNADCSSVWLSRGFILFMVLFITLTYSISDSVYLWDVSTPSHCDSK